MNANCMCELCLPNAHLGFDGDAPETAASARPNKRLAADLRRAAVAEVERLRTLGWSQRDFALALDRMLDEN